MKNTLTFVLLISAFGGLSAPAFAQICSPTVLNPTTPAVTTLTGRGVYISGGKAYVVSENFGLRIVDINDPANPVTLNPTFIPGDNMYTTQTGLGVYVSGDYAYVVF